MQSGIFFFYPCGRLVASARVAADNMWSRQSAVDHMVFIVYVFDVMLYASPLVLLWKVRWLTQYLVWLLL